MILKSVKDLSELTLGEAEELKKAGAMLQMSPEGKILVCAEEPGLHFERSRPEGGCSHEGDAGNGRE